jgi:L-ascorbate metabolism protein UlaG (beta-lactamase superfamily)
MRLTYVGHSTLLIELAGIRLLTDPVLRDRVAHLERRAPPVDPDLTAAVDAVLISHLHHDHFDPGSLTSIDRGSLLVMPRGGRRAAAKLGFERVVEMTPGDELDIAGTVVRATPAQHGTGRWPWARSSTLGFTVAAGQRVYFPGDTDLFDGMRDLAPGLDVALLPVWGWGTRAGVGHLDPHRAAMALQLLRPRVAIPIHWGTLFPIPLRQFRPQLLTEPPLAFQREAARLAPAVEVRVLQPGAATTV